MATSHTEQPQISSARPEMTRAIMDKTGLDEAVLTELVHRFYGRIRKDAVLAPIFASRIKDWPSHLARMVSFWSSVALMTGTYHGKPVPAHVHLPVTRAHFDRWLMLFRETARDVCTPLGTAHVIERAERIARSLHMAVEDTAGSNSDSVPNLL